MEWSLDGTDRTCVGDVRREMLDYLAAHADPGSQLKIAELAFDELVGNACRYAPGPTWVDLDWAEPQPVLHVRDCGPGLDLPAALAAAPDGGLRSLSDLAGPLHVAPLRARGADVSVRLPIRRSEASSAARRSPEVPSPDEAGGPSGREAFLGAVTASLAQTVERSYGPAAAGAAVATVGLAMGARVEEEYRRTRQLTDRLTAQQMAELYVEMKASIGGDFFVISVDDDEVVLGNRRCPFGAAVTESPSLCQMTTSAFAGVATRNTGHGEVRLEQRIAVGDRECRVAARPVPAAGARAALAAHRAPARRPRRGRAVPP
jgi:predicted ArsR family transcriptional regulator